MLPLEFYRWLHIVGLLFIFSGLLVLVGARVAGATPNRKTEQVYLIVHGVGMLFMLVAGFGAMARLGYMTEWPWWIYPKLAIWLALGGSATLAKRKASWGLALILVWIGLAGVGAYLGIFKPQL